MTTSARPATPATAAARVRLAYVIAALPPLFWAGNFLIARAMRDAIPPLEMSFWRWTVAFLILLPFGVGAIRSSLPQIRRELPMLSVLALLGVTGFSSLVYVALHHTTAVNAALINSLMPVATFLFALALLRDRPTAAQTVGVALALAGASTIIARGEIGNVLALDVNRGELLVIAALVCWALYTVLIKWRPTRLAPSAFLPVTFGIGAAFHVPFVVWERQWSGGFAVTTEAVAAILYFAVFPSILAYVFWNRAVAALGPGRTSTYMYLMPIFSAALGVWLLGEPFGAYHAAGVGLVFAGIALVTRRPKGA
ncbi:MAG: DMT family transporter [Gemmatimonas sp.]